MTVQVGKSYHYYYPGGSNPRLSMGRFEIVSRVVTDSGDIFIGKFIHPNKSTLAQNFDDLYLFDKDGKLAGHLHSRPNTVTWALKLDEHEYEYRIVNATAVSMAWYNLSKVGALTGDDNVRILIRKKNDNSTLELMTVAEANALKRKL
jgi:hypothetical protein